MTENFLHGAGEIITEIYFHLIIIKVRQFRLFRRHEIVRDCELFFSNEGKFLWL